MVVKKVVRTGISIDIDIAKKLNDIIKKSPELKLDRSEVVNSILYEYFNNNSSLERSKKIIMKMRKSK